MGRVEGPFFHREQPQRPLAIVRIQTGVAQLVIAAQRFQRLLLGQAGALHQLLQRVCTQQLARLDRFFHQAGRNVVVNGGQLAEQGAVLQLLVRDGKAYRAVAGVYPAYLAGPVAVHKLPGRFTRQVFDLAADLLAGRVFVHKTLAAVVQQQKAGRAEHAAHVVGAGRVGAVLQLGADPHAHAVAVSGVAGLQVFVAAQPQLRRFGHAGAKAPQHLRVAHIVAGGQHHAFFGQRAQVAPFAQLCNGPLHAALPAAQQLHRGGRADTLHQPRLQCQMQVALKHRHVGGPHPYGGLVALEPLGAVFKGFGAGAAPGLQPAFGPLGRDGCSGGHDGDVRVPLQIPVERLAGLVRPAAQDILAGLVGHIAHQVAHDLHLVHLAAAPYLGHTAVHHREVT